MEVQINQYWATQPAVVWYFSIEAMDIPKTFTAEQTTCYIVHQFMLRLLLLLSFVVFVNVNVNVIVVFVTRIATASCGC